MPRRLSLNARTSQLAEASADVPIVLVTITHPSLDEPLRLTTDPTERLSADPLAYGTISNGETYRFVLVSALLPDDRDRVPAAATLEFENVDADIGKTLRSVTTRAQVDLQLVYASAPDEIEDSWTGLEVVRSSGNDDVVSIDISRAPQTDEAWPFHAMTRSRFPGLFR